jgi:hypothetical protein
MHTNLLSIYLLPLDQISSSSVLEGFRWRFMISKRQANVDMFVGACELSGPKRVLPEGLSSTTNVSKTCTTTRHGHFLLTALQRLVTVWDSQPFRSDFAQHVLTFVHKKKGVKSAPAYKLLLSPFLSLERNGKICPSPPSFFSTGANVRELATSVGCSGPFLS